ncbi:hypothetical protein ABTL50_19370, partial [Acinetobacter baumannii]
MSPLIKIKIRNELTCSIELQKQLNSILITAIKKYLDDNHIHDIPQQFDFDQLWLTIFATIDEFNRLHHEHIEVNSFVL